jgi:D-alanyl-D-alanine dipeptidase
VNFWVRQGQGIQVTGDTVALYLGVFYKFFIGLLAVAAVVMVMWGGFKRIMAVGNAEKIADANDSIVSAISGLVLVLVSYSLLNLINPRLTSFKSLAITPVTRIEFQDIEAERIVAATAQPAQVPQVAIISGSNISNPGNKIASTELITSMRAAAAELAKQNVHMIVTSGTRTVAEQTALIIKNCQNPPGSTTCNPKPGAVETCPLPSNNPLSCPHTSGQAVDVWATQGDEKPISQDECKANKPACERSPAMAALISAMRQAGFCKLDSEPWHFEKPPVSVGSCH